MKTVMFKEEVIQICSNISIVQEILLQTGTYRIKRMDFSWSCLKCGSLLLCIKNSKCDPEFDLGNKCITKAFYYLSLGDQVAKPKVIFSLGL